MPCLRWTAGRGIALAHEIGRRELNPNGELVLVGDEVHADEAEVVDVRRAALP